MFQRFLVILILLVSGSVTLGQNNSREFLGWQEPNADFAYVQVHVNDLQINMNIEDF